MQGNVYEFFLKDLQGKFVSLFGPVYHKQNLKIEYFFDAINKKSLIEIYQEHVSSGNNYIKIRFDEVTQKHIESYLTKFCRQNAANNLEDSALNGVLNGIVDGNTYKLRLDAAKKIFNSQNPIFIPAARTQLTLFSNQLLSSTIVDKDIITNSFLRTIQSIRKMLGAGLEEAEQLAIRTQDKHPDVRRAKLARELIKKILLGDYKIVHGDERIYYGNSSAAHTTLSAASSGQQESLWILLTAYLFILEKENVFITIEEPEAHLYPESQDSIMRLLVLLLGRARGTSVLLTTHSPYLLTSINNLLAANYYGENKEREVDSIVNRLLWVNANDLSVYKLGDTGEDIFDKELNMICSEEIDSASHFMNDEYDAILSTSNL